MNPFSEITTWLYEIEARALLIATQPLHETVERWNGVAQFDGEDADYLKPCADHVSAHEQALSAILAKLQTK